MGCCLSCAGGCGGDSETHGEIPKYDPDFKGPIRGRKRCPTDIICLVLFLAFIVGMFAVGIYGWVEGDPSRLVHPVDSNGRFCGHDPGVENKPNLLFFDIRQCIQVVSFTDVITGDVTVSDVFTCSTQQVCVEECPTENGVGIRANPVCVDGVETSQFDVLNATNLADVSTASAITNLIELIVQEKCAPYYIISESLAGRCIPTFADLGDFIEFDNISSFNMTTTPNITSVLLGVSLSDVLDGTLTQILFFNAQAVVYGVLQDLQVVWPAILIGFGITLLICFVYVILMRFIAGIVIAVGIIGGLILLAIVTGFSYFQYYCFRQGDISIPSIGEGLTNSSTVTDFLNTTENFAAVGCQYTNSLRDFIASNAAWFEYQEETWLAMGIIGTLLLLILIIILIIFAKKIAISVAIIKEASKAVGYIPGVVFYPILTWTFIVIAVIFFAVVALFLYTASEAQYVLVFSLDNLTNVTTASNMTYFSGQECIQSSFNGTLGANNSISVTDTQTGTSLMISCMFNGFFTSNFLLYLQLYNLFGLLWVSNYFIALGECTIAGAFASYYWAWNKSKDIPLLTTGAAFARAIFFHTGSLAFGALIIAIIQLIRIILSYIQKKLKRHKENKIAHAILTCLQCLFYLLEKVFRYINRHAYIEIAIYGYNFCIGACKAVKLILRNVLTTAVKDRIVGLLLFMGKIFVVSLIALLGYLGFGQYEEQGRILWQRELNYYLVPLLILIIGAYLIVSGFMSVYHMGVDTIFICALEDQERNNGFDKPYFMSKELQRLMGVHNRVQETTDGGDVKMEEIS